MGKPMHGSYQMENMEHTKSQTEIASSSLLEPQETFLIKILLQRLARSKRSAALFSNYELLHFRSHLSSDEKIWYPCSKFINKHKRFNFRYQRDDFTKISLRNSRERSSLAVLSKLRWRFMKGFMSYPSLPYLLRRALEL